MTVLKYTKSGCDFCTKTITDGTFYQVQKLEIGKAYKRGLPVHGFLNICPDCFDKLREHQKEKRWLQGALKSIEETCKLYLKNVESA